MNISEAFKHHKKYAFRFETLPEYKVTGEWEEFHKFLMTGVAKQYDDLILFQSEIAEMIAKGRRHIRTRVLPETPNNYIRFETEVGYIPQNNIGAEFNFIFEKDFFNLQNEFNLKDYWLFDDEHLFIMEYDSEGRFLGINEERSKEIVQASVVLKNQSLKVAKTLSFLIEVYLIEQV